jgi:hypothetical protein
MSALITSVQRRTRVLIGTVALIGLAAGYCLGRAGSGGGGGGHGSSHGYSSHSSYSSQGDSGATFLILVLVLVGVLLYLAAQNYQLQA